MHINHLAIPVWSSLWVTQNVKESQTPIKDSPIICLMKWICLIADTVWTRNIILDLMTDFTSMAESYRVLVWISWEILCWWEPNIKANWCWKCSVRWLWVLVVFPSWLKVKSMCPHWLEEVEYCMFIHVYIYIYVLCCCTDLTVY